MWMPFEIPRLPRVACWLRPSVRVLVRAHTRVFLRLIQRVISWECRGGFGPLGGEGVERGCRCSLGAACVVQWLDADHRRRLFHPPPPTPSAFRLSLQRPRPAVAAASSATAAAAAATATAAEIDDEGSESESAPDAAGSEQDAFPDYFESGLSPGWPEVAAAAARGSKARLASAGVLPDPGPWSTSFMRAHPVTTIPRLLLLDS